MDNSKGSIDNYEISKIDDKISLTEKMLLIDSNCTNSKNYGNNYDKNNRNSVRIGGKEQKLDNLEGFE